MRSKVIFLVFIIATCVYAQSPHQKAFQEFRQEQLDKYLSFRQEANREYSEFLKNAWEKFEAQPPIPSPVEKDTVGPIPYDEKNRCKPIENTPVVVAPPVILPQPLPIEPIRENPVKDENCLDFGFYGLKCNIRIPTATELGLHDWKYSSSSIAPAWEKLADHGLNNTIRDCLELRVRNNLSDWAFLQLLKKVGENCTANPDLNTLLTTFLYCQCGYQTRLATDGTSLILLYGSQHNIYNKRYFNIGGTNFYPLDDTAQTLNVCNAQFPGEKPLSLLINSRQHLGDELSEPRTLTYAKDISCQVPLALIDFYNTYPTSSIGNNMMTRWAMYANAPLAVAAKEKIYPPLKVAIDNMNQEQAVNFLLSWVQKSFLYEYDNKVWGHDRAFFAEETLYYPYSDCEDRAILFSRIVRDLVGLDVVLVYYPGHLATAVCFESDVKGDALAVDGRRFVICDPTYVGAPVGEQMPKMRDKPTQAILLE